MTKRNILLSITLGFILCSHLGLAATTTRVSVNSLGEEAVGNTLENVDFDKVFVAVSASGNVVAFFSEADNLVANDTNNVSDIFVHDRETGETTRVSINSAGKEGNRQSRGGIAVNADGRFVAFTSDATNLVKDDTNDKVDVFVHDRVTGKTTRVSVGSGGKEGNGDSKERPAISANGRFVAFAPDSTNLVPGDTDDSGGVFVHDRKTGKTTLVSVNSRGKPGNDWSGRAPAISADGRFVAFVSAASNLVAKDTNEYEDVFVHDRKTGKTTLVSVSSRGKQGNAHSGEFTVDISADGRLVAFPSLASNLVAKDNNVDTDIFVHDRKTGKTTLVSVDSLGNQIDSSSRNPAISGDGRFVAFDTDYSDVFRHDRQTGETVRVSVDNKGNKAEGSSGLPAISGDGRFVAFDSDSRDLVANDSNRARDTFLYDRDRDIVNAQVKLEPLAGSFQMVRRGRDCGKGFVSRFLFDNLLENTGSAELANLHMPVVRLSGANKLVVGSALAGPNGEISVPERDDYSDGVLGRGESVTVPMEVCLRKRKPFKLYVDVADDRKTNVNESAEPQSDFRFIVGLDGDDMLKGTSGDDTIIGFDGNDTVSGKGGNDLILGGRGNDDLHGNRGDDEIRGGDGQDALRGGGGEDLLLGGLGNDSLLGNADDDELRGNGGNDALNGGRDIDICKGGSGTNVLRGCEL